MLFLLMSNADQITKTPLTFEFYGKTYTDDAAAVAEIKARLFSIIDGRAPDASILALAAKEPTHRTDDSSQSIIDAATNLVIRDLTLAHVTMVVGLIMRIEQDGAGNLNIKMLEKIGATLRERTAAIAADALQQAAQFSAGRNSLYLRAYSALAHDLMELTRMCEHLASTLPPQMVPVDGVLDNPGDKMLAFGKEKIILKYHDQEALECQQITVLDNGHLEIALSKEFRDKMPGYPDSGIVIAQRQDVANIIHYIPLADVLRQVYRQRIADGQKTPA